MFEIVGMLAVWAIGLGLCFYVPLVGSLLISDRSHNLGAAIIGWMVARALASSYVIATIAYLAIT